MEEGLFFFVLDFRADFMLTRCFLEDLFTNDRLTLPPHFAFFFWLFYKGRLFLSLMEGTPVIDRSLILFWDLGVFERMLSLSIVF